MGSGISFSDLKVRSMKTGRTIFAKFWMNFIIILLTVSLIGLGFFVVYNLSTLSKEISAASLFHEGNLPKYRFMLIIDGTDTNYVEEMESGALKAGRDYQVAFELWSFKGEDKIEKILQQFDIAVESSVDGVIIEAFDDERFIEILGKANARKIPVITIGAEIPEKETVSYISYNEFQIGSKIGSLLDEYFRRQGIDAGTIAMVQNSSLNGQNSRIAIKEKLDEAFHFEHVLIDHMGVDTLGAEEATRDMIRENTDLIAVVCSSGEETLGAIQALKDTNKIGDVMVIGNDDYAEILDYIERGLVYATVVADNELLGYEAIMNMANYKEDLLVSQYKDIRVRLITKSNLEEYRQEVGGPIR